MHPRKNYAPCRLKAHLARNKPVFSVITQTQSTPTLVLLFTSIIYPRVTTHQVTLTLLTLCIFLRYPSTQEPLCSFRFEASLVISASHLQYRRSSKFVAFIGGLRRSIFKIGLRSEIGEFRPDAVHRTSIFIYCKSLNKRSGASAFIMGEYTAATNQLIRIISKLDFVT